MKTMNLFAMFAAAACAVVVLGCENRSGEGEYIFPQDTDTDVFTIDGSTDVEPDESPPDDSDNDVAQDIGDDVPSAAEYCSPYIGTWDCVCTGGTCTEGDHIYYVITPLQQGDDMWMLWAIQVDGGEGPYTCDPHNPPPTDGIVTFQLTTHDSMDLNLQDPDTSEYTATTSCTRLE